MLVFSRLYRKIIADCDKRVPPFLRPLWEHEAGPKTIFFWAPAFKWGLVLASVGDLHRPPGVISFPQVTSLALTGAIWSRYSLVIKPINYNLFTVNLFVFLTNLRQMMRALVMASIDDYRRPLEKVSTTQCATLAATGLVWTRYCLVIRPINYSLSLCNFSLGVANAVQCYRAYTYQRSIKSLVKAV